MNYVEAKDVLKVKTGKYDANHAKINGEYTFFTCALKPFKTDTFSFNDEVIILPGNGANVGEVLYFNGKLEAYQRTYVLHEINAEVKYLFYFFKKYWIRQITKKQVGSATNYIKMDDILSFKIPLPPLKTQQKIAAILDEADKLRQLDKILLKKYEALSQSLFLEMFGDPVSNPKGWDMVPMNHICDFKRQSIKPERISSEMKYIPLDAIQKGTGKILGYESVEEGEIKSSKFYFTENHILYGKLRPYLNKVALPNFDGICSTDIIPILPIESKTNKYFISTIMRNIGFVSFADENSSGANLPRISPKEIEKFSTINPPFESQKIFGERIMEINRQKSSVQDSLKRSEELFNSLLQKAFKGELV